jgi:hypothetical protein
MLRTFLLALGTKSLFGLRATLFDSGSLLKTKAATSKLWVSGPGWRF